MPFLIADKAFGVMCSLYCRCLNLGFSLFKLYKFMQELGIPREAVEMTEAVQELGQGQWEGQLRSEIYTPAMLSVLNSTQPDFRAPGGESQRQVEFRMVEFFNNVAFPRASVAVQAARGYRQRGSKEHLNKTQHASIQVTPLCRTCPSSLKSVCSVDL